MHDTPISFVAGLPRSGSTLLMNLLGQNPRHHVTPTNGLVGTMVSVMDMWPQQPEFRAQGLENIRPRIVSLLKGMIQGFYRDELAAGKMVFDKSRGWLAYIEMLEQVLGRPVNVLVTVRDIRAIVASLERLRLNNPLSNLHPSSAANPADYCQSQTIEGRTQLLFSPSGLLGMAVNRLRDALRRPHHSRIIVIPYDRLCADTQGVLDHIHDALGTQRFHYDPDHVQQITQEDDAELGASFHQVRPKVQITDPTPWKGILPDSVCDALVREFADIQSMAASAGNAGQTF